MAVAGRNVGWLVTTVPLSCSRRCKLRGLYVAIIDDRDGDLVVGFSWSASVVKSSTPIYVFASRKERREGRQVTVLLHRAVWERWNGPIQPGMTVDHIEQGEQGGLDNRLSNLRLATRANQQGNRRKSVATASPFKGVYWHKRAGKWAAQVHINDYPKYLGVFDSDVEAAKAYDAAAREHFGAFAKVNFPTVAA